MENQKVMKPSREQLSFARSALYGAMGHLGVQELSDKAVESVAQRIAERESGQRPPNFGGAVDTLFGPDEFPRGPNCDDRPCDECKNPECRCKCHVRHEWTDNPNEEK